MRYYYGWDCMKMRLRAHIAPYLWYAGLGSSYSWTKKRCCSCARKLASDESVMRNVL